MSACDKIAIMNLYAFLVPYLSHHSEKKKKTIGLKLEFKSQY